MVVIPIADLLKSTDEIDFPRWIESESKKTRRTRRPDNRGWLSDKARFAAEEYTWLDNEIGLRRRQCLTRDDRDACRRRR